MAISSVASNLNAYAKTTVGSSTAPTSASITPISKSVVVAISAKSTKIVPSTIASAVAAYQTASYQGTIDRLAPVTITDSVANLSQNLSVLSEMAARGKITSIKFNEKNASITTSSQVLGNLTNPSNPVNNLLQKLGSKLTIKVENASIASALTITSPSKNVDLQFSIADTASLVSSNLEKLNALTKKKGLISAVTISSNEKILTLKASELKDSAGTLALISGPYSLNLSDVSIKELPSVANLTTVAKVNLRDTAANIASRVTSINDLVTRGKVGIITLTDSVSPQLKIADVVQFKQLPNIQFQPGITYDLIDTASNLVSLSRFDIANILSDARSVSLSDTSIPNLTVADASTLRNINKFSKPFSYNIVDSKAALLEQVSASTDATITNATSISTTAAYTVAEYSRLTKTRGFDQKAAYIIQDTAKNIIKQGGISNDRIIKNAVAVVVQDSSSNVSLNLASLQTLATNQRLTNISLTDTGLAALNLTPIEVAQNSFALGKITSAFISGNGVGYQPSSSASALQTWSSPTSVNIVSNSYNFRTYQRQLAYGSILANVVMPTNQLNITGPRSASFYLTAQDGAGNLGKPVKVADLQTSLPNGYGPSNGSIFTINFASFGANTPAAKNMQAAVWMDLQDDGTYSLLSRTYTVTTTEIANDMNATGVTFNGGPQVLVSGISRDFANFNWTNLNANNNLSIAFGYETLDPDNPTKKNAYQASFSISSDFKTFNQISSNAIQSGANSGAILVAPQLEKAAQTAMITNPNTGQVSFAYETTQNGRVGLTFRELNASTGPVGGQQFLPIGATNEKIKLNFIINSLSTEPSGTGSYWMFHILGVTGSKTDAVTGQQNHFTQFIKLNSWLPVDSATGEMTPLAVTTLPLENQPRGMWTYNLNYNTTLWAFQEGRDVHMVQVDGNNKILSDDKLSLPVGAILDRVRPLNATNTNLIELFWREPDTTNTGSNIIKHQFYDTRGTAPLYVIDNTNNTISYLIGAAGNDTLQGRGSAPQIFAGGGGDDLIIAGTSGQDIASYTGNFADYKLSVDPSNVNKLTVFDLRPGARDGKDTLIGISKIRFADRLISTSSISNS